jgi:hypothetical protein
MCNRANNLIRSTVIMAVGWLVLASNCVAQAQTGCTAGTDPKVGPAQAKTNAQAMNPAQPGSQPGTGGAAPGSAPPNGCPTTKSFGGLTFGAGIALSLNTSKSRVTTAQVVGPNNIVRVSASGDANAGLVLESHYFFVPNVPFFGVVPQGDWGHGPFVAIVADTSGSGGSSASNIISAYALGWMIGLREPTWAFDSTSKTWNATYGTASWNFGVGVRIDPNAQVLGDGIVANAPLPAGETSIRYKTQPSYGLMMLSSFSF